MIERYIIAFVVTVVMILVTGGVLYICKYKKGGVCKMDIDKLSSGTSGGSARQNAKRSQQGKEERAAEKSSAKKRI